MLQLVQGEGIPAKMGNLPLMDIEFQSRLLDDNNQDGFQYVTADYESASGRVLEGQGVVPDESITLTRAQLKADTDPVLSAAKSWILTQPK